MREAFEAWVRDSGSFTDWSRAGGAHTDGDYLKPLVQRTWVAWQAAVAWARSDDGAMQRKMITCPYCRGHGKVYGTATTYMLRCEPCDGGGFLFIDT